MSTYPAQTLLFLKNAVKPVAFAAVALAAVAASPVAQAEELRPVEATSLQLGDVNGVVYYTVQGEGYHLVATLASQDGPPMRFEGTLLPGQKIVVSTPGFAGGTAQSAEFSRQGDRLVVEAPPVPTD